MLGIGSSVTRSGMGGSDMLPRMSLGDDISFHEISAGRSSISHRTGSFPRRNIPTAISPDPRSRVPNPFQPIREVSGSSSTKASGKNSKNGKAIGSTRIEKS